MAPSATERFSNAAESAYGFTPSIQRYPAETRTAQDAADAIGCELGQIVKSLIFASEGTVVLVLTSGSNRVDTAKAATLAGVAALDKADADLVRSATGYAIGGVPPFGHTTASRTVIDEDLMGWDEVWAAAGAPDSVFPLAPTQLVEFTSGTVGPVS